MARGRDRNLTSSLFPFLSVLACVIGTLTLLIAALAVNQVAEDLASRSEESAESPELEAERAAVRSLARAIRDAEALDAELSAARAELRALHIDPAASRHERQSQVDARLAAASAAQRVAALQRESRELDAELTASQSSLVRARSTNDRRTIRIHPRGRSQGLRALFVECRAEGLRIYYEDLDNSLYLDRRLPGDRAQFQKFLRRARSIRNHNVVFLIRPDAVETYDWALGQIRDISVRHAKLPLLGHGELEFVL